MSLIDLTASFTVINVVLLGALSFITSALLDFIVYGNPLYFNPTFTMIFSRNFSNFRVF